MPREHVHTIVNLTILPDGSIERATQTRRARVTDDDGSFVRDADETKTLDKATLAKALPGRAVLLEQISALIDYVNAEQ